jgi:hypothetical protein
MTLAVSAHVYTPTFLPHAIIHLLSPLKPADVRLNAWASRRIAGKPEMHDEHARTFSAVGCP